jgi:hypothetical protein
VTIEIDGEPIMFVSHVELTVDGRGYGEAKLTIPAALLDIDVDAAAFVTAHVGQDSAKVGQVVATSTGCTASFRDARGTVHHCIQDAGHYDPAREPIWATPTGPIDANGWHADAEAIWPDTSPGATPHTGSEA